MGGLAKRSYLRDRVVYIERFARARPSSVSKRVGKIQIAHAVGVVVLLSATALCPAQDAPSPGDKIAREIIRGSNAANFATRDLAHIGRWGENFRTALQSGSQHHTNSDWFLLGAKFMFSFRVALLDSTMVGASDEQLKAVAVQGTFARIGFEKLKRTLHVTDADVMRILAIDRDSFLAWKHAVQVNDDDDSVISDGSPLRL